MAVCKCKPNGEEGGRPRKREREKEREMKREREREMKSEREATVLLMQCEVIARTPQTTTDLLYLDAGDEEAIAANCTTLL
jgi:hypothetical protein